LLYGRRTGDWSRKENSIRQLNWATYSVDIEGRNEYPGDPATNEIWFTDGYGDYFVHYLKAMALLPCELMPADADHLVSSTSVVTHINYGEKEINYEVFDKNSTEILRLTSKPQNITSGDQDPGSGIDWEWESCTAGGGELTIKHKQSNIIRIMK
jgi:hypothetical protein